MKARAILPAASWIRRPLLGASLALGLIAALAAGVPGAPATARASAAAAAPAGTWRLLPRAPATPPLRDVTAVWTGREMIIHGNAAYDASGGGIRGFTLAYRPATRTWVRLAGGPARPSAFETSDVAVWTGSRMLVFGQTSASYNPAANTWSAIPQVPMSASGAVTGWTGRQFLAWGGACCDDQSNSGVAYSLASNSWRGLPAAPLSMRRSASGTWTGRDLIVAGGEHREGLAETSIMLRDAAAYNLATGKWRKLSLMPRRGVSATGVWDGREMLLIGGSRPGVRGPAPRSLAYSPAANRWRYLPAMAFPRNGFAAVWTGRQLLVWGGLTGSGVPPPHGEAYTPAANAWTALPASPLRGRESPVAVWTGRQMIVWGGFSSGKAFRVLTDGAVYTPAR